MINVDLRDYYQPREYQKKFVKAFRKGFKRLVLCFSRRSGKDITALSLTLEYAIQHTGIYWYIWPNAEQGRKHAWNGKLLNGKPLFSVIPDALIKRKNISDMSIELINDSFIQILGSEKVSTLRGGNPTGVIMTEYAFFSDPECLEVVLPILRANGGWLMILSTVNGHNKFWDVLQIAKANPNEWFHQVMTVDESKHISIEEIQHDIDTGLMSYEKARREYWCDFDVGYSGTIYGETIERLRAKKQITSVPYDANYPVNTNFDIGRDTTAIIYWQVCNKEIHLIDYYESKGKGLEFYIKEIKSKEYLYDTHFFPHDGSVIEWAGPEYTRAFKAQRFGLNVSIVPRVLLADGIEWARAQSTKMYIDEEKCKKLISCLDNYQYEFNEKTGLNTVQPKHDWSSHGASAFMYLALSIDKTEKGMTPEDVDAIRKEALYGRVLPLSPENKWANAEGDYS